ncbi:MAG TPA: LapA family protein [Smithella sp.]|nr:LapA family protein [Smithella sp.]
MNYKIGLIAILAFIVLIFLAQNMEVTTVRFLFWSISMSRAVLLFFSVLIGFMIGWFLHSYISYSNRKRH